MVKFGVICVIVLFLQIGDPHLEELCTLVIPCALTALDHWSPEVKVCALYVSSNFSQLQKLIHDLLLSVLCCSLLDIKSLVMWHLSCVFVSFPLVVYLGLVGAHITCSLSSSN